MYCMDIPEEKLARAIKEDKEESFVVPKVRRPTEKLNKLRFLIGKEGECSMCGAEKSTNGKSLHIHHVDENQNNNKPENLLLICSKCHRHAHVKYWRPNFDKWEPMLKEARLKGHKFVTKN